MQGLRCAQADHLVARTVADKQNGSEEALAVNRRELAGLAGRSVKQRPGAGRHQAQGDQSWRLVTSSR